MLPERELADHGADELQEAFPSVEDESYSFTSVTDASRLHVAKLPQSFPSLFHT